jgi:hypothetical protein
MRTYMARAVPMRATPQVVEHEGYSWISSKRFRANLSPHPTAWDTLSCKVLVQWSRDSVGALGRAIRWTRASLKAGISALSPLSYGRSKQLKNSCERTNRLRPRMRPFVAGACSLNDLCRLCSHPLSLPIIPTRAMIRTASPGHENLLRHLGLENRKTWTPGFSISRISASSDPETIGYGHSRSSRPESNPWIR